MRATQCLLKESAACCCRLNQSPAGTQFLNEPETERNRISETGDRRVSGKIKNSLSG